MSEQKIEQFWRDATAEDVAEIAKTCKPKDARVRDFEYQEWREVELSGFVCRATYNWVTLCSGSYQQCQVYDPPQWFLDKPDPGEGFRLLEKFLDEDVLLGDSVFCPDSKRWLKLDTGFEPGQRHGLWYRRRIEPVEPVKAISMSDFEAICNGELVKGYAYKLPNGQTITITAKGFEVAQ